MKNSVNIIYASCACSSNIFELLYGKKKKKPGQQVQKYHRLLATGFAENGCKVNMVSAPPITRSYQKDCYFNLKDDIERNVFYHYLPVLNIPVLRNILILFFSFILTLKLLFQQGKTVVICDILNQSVSVGALLAARLLRKQCVGIVTDLPEMLNKNNRSFGLRFNQWILKRYTSYIFLTDKMNERINVSGKPYVVVEGHVDAEMIKQKNLFENKYKNFVCHYAGAISKRYGLNYLVEGFIMAHLPDAELHLYGDGDYVEELKKICANNSSVKYYGVKLNNYVVKVQIKSTLLINPRPTVEEFTLYSFPSKNMEYMASGTSVLTTKLPGMPEEYNQYVYLLEEESKFGIMENLETLYKKKREELHEKGIEAKKFVIDNKNNKVQARKILKMIKGENNI